MRHAVSIELSPEQKDELRLVVRSGTRSQRLVQRAQVAP